MKLNESAENYLETILILQKEKGSVRSIDIANELDYSKPSVSRAVKLLRKGEHIVVDKSGYITLTEKGQKIAEIMYERHTLLSNLLIDLGVNKEVAVSDACKIEHVISSDSFEKVKEFYNKIKEENIL